MEGGKTGALLSCAAAIGRHPRRRGALECRPRLATFGRQLGLAFQAVDDRPRHLGGPGRTGKPTFARPPQHKKTLPVCIATSTAARSWPELGETTAGCRHR